MKDADYLLFAANVLEECVRILKRHNDGVDKHPIGPNDSDWKCRYCGRWLPDYKQQCYCGRER